MRIILAILLLSPVAFGQWDAENDSTFIVQCDTVTDFMHELDRLSKELYAKLQDPPKPKCPDFVEIFYIDTVGWYLDTIVVEIPCPTLKYQEEGSYAGCLVMHTGLKIVWKPKIETKSIFKFEPSTFEHFERWKIRKK